MHKFFRNKHPFTTHLRRNLQIEESYTALLCLLTQKSNIYVLKFKETIKKKNNHQNTLQPCWERGKTGIYHYYNITKEEECGWPESSNMAVAWPQTGKDQKLVHRVLDPQHKRHATAAHKEVCSTPLVHYSFPLPEQERSNYPTYVFRRIL